MDYSNVLFSFDTLAALITSLYLLKLVLGKFSENLPEQFKYSLRGQRIVPRY